MNPIRREKVERITEGLCPVCFNWHTVHSEDDVMLIHERRIFPFEHRPATIAVCEGTGSPPKRKRFNTRVVISK